MGLGKSIIAEFVAFLKSLRAMDPNSGVKGPFGYHIVVAQAEVLAQYALGALKFFKGKREYYIVTSAPMASSMPGITIIAGTAAWERFQEDMYTRRDNPEVISWPMCPMWGPCSAQG